MKNISAKVEFTANILIAVVALMLIAFIAQRYFLHQIDAEKQPAIMQPTIGKKVELPDLEFPAKGKTVFLVLQTTCRFCNNSMPFYKHLVEETKDKEVRFIAVFPTRVEDGVKYLTDLGISNIEVRHAELSKLEASGTPTIIITNAQGQVTNFWVGQLPPAKESEVIDQINKFEN